MFNDWNGFVIFTTILCVCFRGRDGLQQVLSWERQVNILAADVMVSPGHQ